MHYSPFRRSTCSPKGTFARDLHVLAMPPAFILSQDQTLKFNIFYVRRSGGVVEKESKTSTRLVSRVVAPFTINGPTKNSRILLA